MSFNDYIQEPSSEKISLCWLHPRQRILEGWNGGSAPTYSFSANYYVRGVIVGQAQLVEASSSSLSSGEFFFDATTKILYVRLFDDTSPADSFTVVEYRLFYSNAPKILPFDLQSGREVEYEALMKSESKFSADLDSDDLTGISLTGSGNVTLENNDGNFDDIFEKLFWEGTEAQIFSYGGGEAKRIFKGFIETKKFSPISVIFRVVDFVDKLRDEVPLPYFSSIDGDLSASVLGRPKRRIYGRADGVKTVHLDPLLDGFSMQGTFSGTAGTATINASGANILNELSPDDTVFYIDGNDEKFSYSVQTVDISGNFFTITENIDKTFSAQSLKNSPSIPYRGKNRIYHVSSHELREPTTTVVDPIQLNRIEVASVADMESGDFVFFGSTRRQIKRISGNILVLETNLDTSPVIGSTVFKSSIQKCYIDKEEAILNRDFTVQNTGGECKIVLDGLAEFNIVRPNVLTGANLTFTNGSKLVSGSGTRFKEEIKPRDWLLPVGESNYYEVLQVTDDTNLVLRQDYSDVTVTAPTIRKRPNYANDETIISVDCLGKTKNNLKTGEWIKYGPEIVRDLLEESGLTVNTASFDSAITEVPYLMSVLVPADFGSDRPIVRDVIDRVNVSIFGSLYNNFDYEITYSVMTPNKENITETISDADVIDFDLSSSGKNITKTITFNYRHFDHDRFTGEIGSASSSIENEYVSNISSINREEIADFYVYNDLDAEILGSRLSLLRETSNSVMRVSTKLALIRKSLNTPLLFSFDRLFNRYGTANDKNRIGYISKIAKNHEGVDVEITDVSGMMNKVAIITEDTASDFPLSSEIERSLNGYITEDNGIITNNEEYRTNLIG